MNKKKNVVLIIGILMLGLLSAVGSYAYWSWKSAENKNIVFNTSKDLQEYIVYDEGESKFVGDFKVSDTYLDGVHTTVSIYKKSEAKDIILYASIYMRVNEIGTNLANSEGLKWVVTKGNSTSNGEVLAEGNFIGRKNKDEFMLLDGIEVTETLEEYTIWLWLDSKYATEEMSGEKVDTSIWTQVDQYAKDNFEITSLSNDYQIIKATVVNSSNNIVSYAVTNSNTEPNTWIDISDSEQRKIYNLSHVVTSTGTYYVWFKDTAGKTVNDKININDIYTQGPICTWGNSSKDTLKDGETATITLTCIDTSATITKSEITSSDITLSSNILTLSNDIVKEQVTNGYKYTYNVTGTDNDGETTLTLKDNVITNTYNVGNNSVASSNITVKNTYTINYDANGGDNAPQSQEKTHGVDLILSSTIPTKTGYTFLGWSESQTAESATYKAGASYTTEGNATLYAVWRINKVYIKYHVNGGEITASTTSSGGTVYNWTTVDDIVHLNGGLYRTNVSYGSSMPSSGLPDYNNPAYINIAKSGYSAVSGAEWKCISGCTTLGKTYNQRTAYTASDFCDVSNGDCIVVVGVNWEANKYTVNFNGNMFSTVNSQTINGLTLTYDYANSYLTINGTPTTTWITLNYLMGLKFNEGDKYNLTSTYISGSFTNTAGGSSGGTIAIDVKNSSKANVSTRNHADLLYINSGNSNATLTINSAAASEGAGFAYWLWFNTPSNWTFTNYKVKVNITKVESKQVTYSGTYGNMPTPTRGGYTFDGWYTGEKGTGTKITSDSVISITANQTLYAKWNYNTIYVKFKTNGGTLTTSTSQTNTSTGVTTTYKWSTDSNGYITKSTNGGTATNNLLSYRYGTTNINLPDYNNPNYLKISKNGYNAKSGAEWICESGCSTANKTFSHATINLNSSDDLCDATKENCTIVLKVNWIDNISPTGNVSLTYKNNIITAKVTASDTGSGIKNYGYLITTNSTCPTSGYTTSTNTSYNFNVTSSGKYYVCVKVTDNAGNSKIISNNINIGIIIDVPSGLIPIKYEGASTVKTVSASDSSWGNYDNKQWANAILVKESGTHTRQYYQSNVGVTVPEADILAYYVYIPRYKYKIWTTGLSATGKEQEIEIIFENKNVPKSKGTKVGEYLTHPAFTFGNKELNGIWLGKFELTGTSSQPTIKPSVVSLRGLNESTLFQTILKFAGGTLSNGAVSFSGSSTYGLIANVDSHMVKNSEWGAATYLSHSKYGRCTNGSCEDVRRNNNSSYYTGYSAVNVATTGWSNTSSSTNQFGTSSSVTQPYNTSIGYKASTTGNIYGIYDMSGGNWDRTMGVLANSSGKPYPGSSGFTIFPDSKYYDLYTSTNSSSNSISLTLTACNGGVCFGHSLSETSKWYNENAYFVYASEPWVIRGGYFNGGSYDGLFDFDFKDGAGYSHIGSRAVLCI